MSRNETMWNVKEQYQAKISNRFVALENVDADVDISSAWETVRI
jgi:hypothetical protein